MRRFESRTKDREEILEARKSVLKEYHKLRVQQQKENLVRNRARLMREKEQLVEKCIAKANMVDAFKRKKILQEEINQIKRKSEVV